MGKSGNLKKYESHNPLKKALIYRFEKNLIQVLREKVRSLEQGEKLTLCDCGCGEGFIDRALLDAFPHLTITGYDIDEKALSFAKSLNPEVQYFKGDILTSEFEEKYDIVLCTEVLEHLQDPDQAIRVLQNVAIQACIITVPHEPFFCLGNFLSLKNVSRFGNPEDHINHWTTASFQKYMKKMDKNGSGGHLFYSFPWQGYLFSLRKEKAYF